MSLWSEYGVVDNFAEIILTGDLFASSVSKKLFLIESAMLKVVFCSIAGSIL